MGSDGCVRTIALVVACTMLAQQSGCVALCASERCVAIEKRAQDRDHCKVIIAFWKSDPSKHLQWRVTFVVEEQGNVLRGPSRRAGGSPRRVTAGHFETVHARVTSRLEHIGAIDFI